jgi:ribose/xylose/arabinose/galactoside ABC-type transport system permease subunit
MNLRFGRDNPYIKPLFILIAVVALLVAADGGGRHVLTSSTLFSTLETFAASGLVALGLGLTMIAGEFDISVVGVYSLAGCVAVLAGGQNPYLGALAAMATGAAIGVVQGLIVAKLRLSSVAVTLGGMLTCNGLASVLTGNQSISYSNIDVALAIANPVAGPLTIRSIITFAMFALVAAIVAFTRPGRDLIALGSDRRAAATAGVPVGPLLVTIFGFSGLCAALAGALISYSLASASPSGLSDVILPAAAASILGGVSLGGGSGRPLGLMLGVLTLSFLRAGFNALGAPPFVNDLAMGAILLAVGILDGPDLMRRMTSLRLSLGEASSSK